MIAPSSGKIAISPRLSVALDVARAAAALYVVLHHLAHAMNWLHGAGTLLRFGQEAVLVFFLLSGFVIHANERTRALRPYGYYLRRLRRIYPPLICAMLVSTLVALWNGTILTEVSASSFFATIASLQDISALKPGVIADPFLSNDPLWSLSYEVAFYLLYPPVLRLWSRSASRAHALVGAAGCLAMLAFSAAPNHFLLVIAYFPLWWCGAMAAEAYARGGRSFAAIGQPVLWVAGLCGAAAFVVYRTGYRGFGVYPFLCFRHFAVALVLFVLLFGPLGRSIATVLQPAKAPAAFLASISYGLYVLHYPLLAQWDVARRPAGLAAAIVLLAILAYLVDRRLPKHLPRAPAT